MSLSSNNNTIYLKNNLDSPIKATGVLLYKFDDSGKMKLLVIYNKCRYEDIGGKIDIKDNTIYDTVGRKIEKVTNSFIKKQDIIGRLPEARHIYIPKMKYLVFLLEATPNERKLQKNDFEEKELYNNIRTIGWIDRFYLSGKHIIKYRLNHRIKYKKLFDTLINIETRFKYRKRLLLL